MNYALVMFGATVDDDAFLLTDGTWESFPRMLVKLPPRRPDVWLFPSEDAAMRVRRSWHRPDLGVVAVRPTLRQGGLFSVSEA